MSIAEPNYASGALHIMPPKKRKLKHGKIEVGKFYDCDLTKIDMHWSYSFIGEVLIINGNSAVVKIVATQLCDDDNIGRCLSKAVVPFKYMRLREGETE